MSNHPPSNSDNKSLSEFSDPKLRSLRIVKGIYEGDQKAEHALVNYYWKGLVFVLNKRANNPDLAQDIAQDTFIVVIGKIRKGELNHPEALSAFIRQTGVNILIGHFRKETRQATDSTEHIDITIPAQDLSYFQLLNNQKIVDIVHQCINKLDIDRDRLLLQNYFVYEKTKIQICEDFSIDSALFDKVLYRARARLKEAVLRALPSEIGDKEPANSVKIVRFLTIIILAGAGYVVEHHQAIQNNSTLASKLPSEFAIMSQIVPSPLFQLNAIQLREHTSKRHLINIQQFIQDTNYYDVDSLDTRITQIPSILRAL